MARALLALGLAVALCGCTTTTLVTSHEYVLLRGAGPEPVLLPDDDPLYQQFEAAILSDPYLTMLISVYENTTQAFLATNIPPPSPAANANHLMIVLDSPTTGALYNLAARYQQHEFRVEVALGLGNDGQIDLLMGRQKMARAMGPVLLELVGAGSRQRGPGRRPNPTGDSVPLDRPTDPEIALRMGFASALEAMHDQERERSTSLSAGVANDEHRARISELSAHILGNAFPSESTRSATSDDKTKGGERSRGETLCTPEVVAALLVRLLQDPAPYYPQRHLLWFSTYTAEQTMIAKVLLAANRISRREPVSAEALIRSYIDTFPTDKERILELVSEVTGTRSP